YTFATKRFVVIMKEARTPKPTEAELKILEVLWERGPLTVRQVNERLNETQDTGYTTTLKLMQIMHAKGLLDRQEEGRTHVYRALVEEGPTRQQLLDRFLETAFGGSATRLVMHALGGARTTPDELKKIRKLLDQLEGGKHEKP